MNFPAHFPAGMKLQGLKETNEPTWCHKWLFSRHILEALIVLPILGAWGAYRHRGWAEIRGAQPFPHIASSCAFSWQSGPAQLTSLVPTGACNPQNIVKTPTLCPAHSSSHHHQPCRSPSCRRGHPVPLDVGFASGTEAFFYLGYGLQERTELKAGASSFCREPLLMAMPLGHLTGLCALGPV